MYLKVITFAIFFLLTCAASAEDLKEIARERVVSKAQTFLNSVHTIIANFKQYDQQGKVRTGQLYLSKPDKMRFDYTDSQRESIILDQDFLLHYNYELKETNYVSVDSFPVTFLNKEFIDLKKDVKVLSAVELKDVYVVDMEVVSKKAKKRVIMEFSKSPIMLHSISIHDEMGNDIDIKFQDIKLNQPINDEVFSIIFNS